MRRWISICFLIVSVTIAGEAAAETDLQGLYQNPKGEVMKIVAKGSIISVDVYSHRGSLWELTTTWGTTMTKPNYAEFRQRAEPDGLWLSLLFTNEGAILESHNNGSGINEKNLFKKLSEEETRKISDQLK